LLAGVARCGSANDALEVVSATEDAVGNSFARAVLVSAGFGTDLGPEHGKELRVFTGTTQRARQGNCAGEPALRMLRRDLVEARQAAAVMFGKRILSRPELTACLAAKDGHPGIGVVGELPQVRGDGDGGFAARSHVGERFKWARKFAATTL
jgi:hypothetical protein